MNQRKTRKQSQRIQSFQAAQKASSQGGAVASFVYTEKFGARAALSKNMLEAVGADGTACMGYDGSGVYVGAVIDGCNEYALRDGGSNKMNIYCKPLIEEIAEQFQLDYSEQSTHSFYEVEYLEIDGYTVAFIPVESRAMEMEAVTEE